MPLFLWSYPKFLHTTAASHFATRSYNCYISSTLPHSRPDNHSELEVCNTSNFSKFSTNSFPSCSCSSRIKAGNFISPSLYCANISLFLLIYAYKSRTRMINLFHFFGEVQQKSFCGLEKWTGCMFVNHFWFRHWKDIVHLRIFQSFCCFTVLQ